MKAALVFIVVSILVGIAFQQIFQFEPIRFFCFWIPFSLATLFRDKIKSLWNKRKKSGEVS